jgi:hypothetical protein
MAVDPVLKYADVGDLYLDPKNPRLGRGNTSHALKQPEILEIMRDWTLEELAVSFLENGYWPQEALVAVKETIYGKQGLVIVEGNRRLAALKLLDDAFAGEDVGKRWKDLVKGVRRPANLFKKIPYILIDNRNDVAAFLGFRHVTGIKEWKPAEKAEYIAHLIEEKKLTYQDVTRMIGSKLPSVRQNYISYRLLLQMEKRPDISINDVEDRFSVLYLSLRTEGVQTYLNIDIGADPNKAQSPVPRTHLKALSNFARWLFGTDKDEPLVADSRQVDRFGQILESEKAVAYLERTDRPSFDMALGLAGGDEPEVVRLIERAADNVEAALSRAHRYAKSKKLAEASERLGEDTMQLLTIVPEIKKKILAKQQ